MSRHVPLFKSRILSLLLALAAGVVAVYAAFHAKYESAQTKGGAQAAVDTLGLGVKVNIITDDVFVSGEIEGIAQLGLAILSGLLILLLLLDTSKRHAVPNAPNVRKAPWSSRTLLLQVLCLGLATVATLVTGAVTTNLVYMRQAKVVSTFANGTVVPSALVESLSKQLGISPVYKDHGYLKFLAIAAWPGFVFSLIATIITFSAWRRFKNARREMSDTSYDSTEKF